MQQFKSKLLIFSALVLSVFVFTLCKMSKKNEITAKAVIESKSDSKLVGTVTFTEKSGVVNMEAAISGATPGTHAIHIHEKGDCTAADATSAAGHWNPTKEAHGKWGSGACHRGDIGNIEVGADGKGKLTMSTNLWCIGCNDMTKDITGKSIIIHGKADDFTTQPTGNAGARQGCGVITKQ
jgi:Cu-Zn family superoxide dismutase